MTDKNKDVVISTRVRFARNINGLPFPHKLSGQEEIYSVLMKNTVDCCNKLFAGKFYKTGETAKAILNYERALLLQPGDKDAKYNLAMAQRSTVDNIKVLPELFLVRWYNGFVTAFTADQWAYVSVFLFICFLVMSVVFFHATSISMKKRKNRHWK